MLSRLVPTIFYADVTVGVDLFVDGLGLEVVHRDDDLVVVQREGVKLDLVQDAEYAAKDRPQVTIETDDIEALHADVAARRPDLLHPNLPAVKRREWGALEFALLDSTTVCVVVRQWQQAGSDA